MKKILMIATGGTIASKGTADGLAPELTSQDILHYILSLKDICEVETLQLCNLDSTNISMEHWMMMANAIEEKYEKYDGFVICHGTDTMAYTASALSYLVQHSPKPIVLTGSQKPVDMEITDARANLLDSFIYASSDDACGVQIVFSGKVILGTRARKVRTKSFQAFTSINYPSLAVIQDGRKIQYIHQVKAATAEFYHKMDPKVGLMKLIPGMNQLAGQIDEAKAGNKMKKSTAIIQSMTMEERENPNILRASRKNRIAKGSGTTVADVNRLLNEYEKMKQVMKQMGAMTKSGKMPNMGGMGAMGAMKNMRSMNKMMRQGGKRGKR